MSQPMGGGAPREEEAQRQNKSQERPHLSEDHISSAEAQAIATGEAITSEVRAHLERCVVCRKRLARAEESVAWLRRVSEASIETDTETEEEPVDATSSAVDVWRATRKALDEMKPFRLRLEAKTGRITRVDRRRVAGPHGRVEGGVRLPLGERHAADIVVTGSPPGLEVVVAEIADGQPARFVRFAQVGIRAGKGKGWRTASTDPTGRVRLKIPRCGTHVLEIVHTLSGKDLLGKIEIEVR